MLKLTRLIAAHTGTRSIRIFAASSYKSDISLETLYPKSKQTLFTPSLPTLSQEKFNGHIPVDQLQITYDRASGPGGQNVNKVATKVDLRFHVQSANWIPENAKQRLIEENKMKINKEGFLIIKSDVTRYQHMNLADALEKLRNMIREAEKPKKVELSAETLEKIRKRQESAANQRLVQKRQKSATKEGRKAPKIDF